MNKKIPGTGARQSKTDVRTVQHKDMRTMGSVVEPIGGYKYSASEIRHQHNVGICTAISLTQNAEKAIGRKFSADFQYLLQKKYFDKDWLEGSSIFNALRVGKTYGFLPLELFTEIKETDRELPYEEYIAKLQAIPESRILDLIKECSDYKLDGYSAVDISNVYSVINAINYSKSGILFRLTVGNEWYTAKDGRISWAPVDINPLRSPKNPTSGHAIVASEYDLTLKQDITLANTWGSGWNRQGLGDIIWTDYSPTEAWIPYYGLNELQLQELKSKLQKKLTILQQIIALYLKIKEMGR